MDVRLSYRQKGYSLLELLIATVIGLFIFAGTMSVFVGLRTTTEQTASYGELQENGRFAIALLTEDLMRVGFWGDYSGELSTTVLLNPDDVFVGDDCVGGGLNNGTFPGPIGHFREIWGDNAVTPSPFGCGPISDVKLGTDVLQIKRVMAFPERINELDGGRFYATTDGNSGFVFAGNRNPANIPVLENGRIWEYQHHIYFIREDERGANVVPVLHRAFLNIENNIGPEGSFVNPNPLVEGVEDIRILYGVDNSDDGVVDLYLPESSMTDVQWDEENDIKIIAAQVHILVREILPDPNYENTNTYRLGDKVIDVNDNYRRMVFSSTVRLQNSRLEVWD